MFLFTFFSGKYKSRRNDKTYSGPIFVEKLPVFIAQCGQTSFPMLEHYTYSLSSSDLSPFLPDLQPNLQLHMCNGTEFFSNPHSVWQLNKFQLSVRNNLQCNRAGWFRLCHEPSEYHKCRQPFRDHQVKWFLCSDMHVLGLHVLVIVEVKCAT